MEINAKVDDQHSATMPLLPVSVNPTNPYSSQLIKPRCIAKFSLVLPLIILLPTLLLGCFACLCIFMSPSQVPHAPNFQINSFFMSMNNISDTTLVANWDMTLTIKNPNLLTWVRFNHIKGTISYNDNLLGISSVEPFVLGLKEHKMVQVKISMKAGLEEDDYDHQAVGKKRVLDEITIRQRENGAVRFSMQMFVWATYRTGWWGTQNVVMSPRCLDLKVGFLPGVGFGSWISHEGPMMCPVPILID